MSCPPAPWAPRSTHRFLRRPGAARARSGAGLREGGSAHRTQGQARTTLEDFYLFGSLFHLRAPTSATRVPGRRARGRAASPHYGGRKGARNADRVTDAAETAPSGLCIVVHACAPSARRGTPPAVLQARGARFDVNRAART